MNEDVADRVTHAFMTRAAVALQAAVEIERQQLQLAVGTPYPPSGREHDYPAARTRHLQDHILLGDASQTAHTASVDLVANVAYATDLHQGHGPVGPRPFMDLARGSMEEGSLAQNVAQILRDSA